MLTELSALMLNSFSEGAAMLRLEDFTVKLTGAEVVTLPLLSYALAVNV